MYVYSVAQLCPSLCDPLECSPLGFSVREVFLAITLEWVAISFSRASDSQDRGKTRVSYNAGSVSCL